MNRYLNYFRNTGIFLSSLASILIAVVLLFSAHAQNNDGFGPADLAVTSYNNTSSLATFSDTFDRADSSPMSLTSSSGGTWETGVGGFDGMQIVGNAATGVAGADSAMSRVVSPTFANNQSSTITFGSGNVKGACVRMSNGGDGYLAFFSTATIQLYKTVASSGTQLNVFDLYGSASSGWTLTLEVSGTTLTVKTNGVQVGTYSDASFSSGQPGMWSGSADGTILEMSATDL